MASTHSLEGVKQTLWEIVHRFSQDDWDANSTVLSKIRGLTSKPRDPLIQRASNAPIKISTNSLETLLKLPGDGQPHLNQTVSVLETLRDEESVTSYSQSLGLKPRAIAVARAVVCSLRRTEDIYADIWHGGGQFYASDGTTAARLLGAEDSIGGEADVNGARYRINALVFAFYFRALCDKFEREELNSKKTETIVVESLIEETGKSRDQIQTLLKRGRWYAQWIDRLGVGAIMLLGRSLAHNNRMTDMDHLVEVCKAIPGFRKRSQDLLQPSLRAIIRAFTKSGQAVPHEAQLYVENHGEITSGPGQRCIEYAGPAGTSAGERTEDFGAERRSRDEATGLQALVVAADQIESYTPEQASIAAQRRPTRDAQAQQQPRSQDEGLIAGQVPGLPPTQAGAVPPVTFGQQAPWQMHTNGTSPANPGAPAGAHVPFAATGQVQTHEPGSTSRNSQHELAVDTQAPAQSRPGAWNEGMIAGQVPRTAQYKTNLVAAVTHAHDVQSPWHMYANQRSPAIPGAFVGPHVPVAAAGRVEAGDSELPTYSYHHHLTRDTQQNISAEAAQSEITRASFPAPGPSPNTGNAGDQQNFLPQWQPCASRSGSHQGSARTSSTGNALAGTIPSNAMLLESNETVYPTGAAHHSALPEQIYLGTSHGYGGASGSGSTWEECSNDQFANLLDIWDVTFP